MFLKFLADNAADSTKASKTRGLTFRKGYYIFYGTLMDPLLLSKVLQISGSPKMRPAMVVGYHTKLCGQYPALSGGLPLHTVHGVAYEVQSQEQLDRLVIYMTATYNTVPCLIQFLDGDQADDNRFGWYVHVAWRSWNATGRAVQLGRMVAETKVDGLKSVPNPSCHVTRLHSDYCVQLEQRSECELSFTVYENAHNE